MRSILGLLMVILVICRLGEPNNNEDSEDSKDSENNIITAFLRDGIVPQIIPRSPAKQFHIKRGNKEIEPGYTVPAFNLGYFENEGYWPSDHNTMYTLIFLNADVNYILYESYELLNLGKLIVNLPGDKLTAGDVLMNFKPNLPFPGYGPQRYLALVYKQKKRINPSLDMMMRVSTTDKFNLTDFISKCELGDPMYGNFFFSSLSICNDSDTESCFGEAAHIADG